MLLLLQEKQTLAKQEATLRAQSAGIRSVGFAVTSIEDTVQTVEAMSYARQTLGKQLKSFNIDSIADTQDDLEDLMADVEEITSVMGRAYAAPDIEDIDLESEIASFGEWDLPVSTPSYFESLPTVEDTIPSAFPAPVDTPITLVAPETVKE